jgi:thymidine phosphorylase
MTGPAAHPAPSTLRLKRMGIDTYQEPVLYMRRDCHVCLSEGFEAQSRVELALNGTRIVATLNVVDETFLSEAEAGVSEAAWRLLRAQPGAAVTLRHPPPLESLGHVRAKVYGRRLTPAAFDAVITDVAAGRYSDLQLAAFVTACAGERLDLDETISLTRSMVNVGDRMRWSDGRVMDKHSVGGLPGNRTTMLIVPIVAACGLRMPKTSSRAITSPAGTADAMETVAPVELDVPQIRKVVEATGGCIVWGGSVRLSPADDILIRVEQPLDLDSQGQLVASVLSKKAAAGATHVLIDMPVGPTAKVRSAQGAELLSRQLTQVGEALGMCVRVARTDGSAPVGRGIGPSLEARDVLAVLRRESGAPADLAQRAVHLAGQLLEFGEAAAPGQGVALAASVLEDGRAWRKFQEICEAQGGLREPPRAAHTLDIVAQRSGSVVSIDNRRLARVAKLAGAPKTPCAGIDLHVQDGEFVERGQALFTLHAASRHTRLRGRIRAFASRHHPRGRGRLMHVIALPGGSHLATILASALGCDYSELFTRSFPDGETLVRIDAAVEGEPVIFAGSLDRPDSKTLALIFAADAARELGATKVGLVAPYLAYMRQDARFHPGEAISSRSYACVLSSCLDFLVTVDPHLHRWQSLSDIYTIPTEVVPAAPAIAAWISANVPSPLIVGPDSESEQWAAHVAHLAGAPHTVMSKIRHGDREVGVELGNKGPWPGRTPVLVDDIISTGHTLIAAAQALRETGLGSPVCIGVHALFDAGAQEQMRVAGIARVLSCDTVPHATNAIAIGPALAQATRRLASA